MKKLFVALAATAALAGLAGCSALGMKSPERTAGQAVDDATIGTKLKAAYAADPELSALKINVDTLKGDVTLKGEIKSMALRRKAEEHASKIQGVKSVNNQLVI